MFACASCGVSKPAPEFRVHKRGYRIGKCRECEREYQRERSRKDPAKYRERKRVSMANRRAADITAARLYSRTYHAENRDERTAKMREYSARRFFWTKAMKLRGEGKASTKQVAALWKAQRGLCALTGRKMDRSAQLDHILPKARSGGDEIGNLQWLCGVANLAKRDLTDSEFRLLCGEVMAWIGQRIDMVERLTAPLAEAAE